MSLFSFCFDQTTDHESLLKDMTEHLIVKLAAQIQYSKHRL